MTKPVILVFVDYYLPGFKAGGTIRSVANLVDALSDAFSFRVVTRDRDHADKVAYAHCRPGHWQDVGKARVMYLPAERRSRKFLLRLINQTRHNAVYLNSFFSPVFTIMPLALRRIGLTEKRPVVLAPRGELAPGALRLKWTQKLSYILLARWAGLCHHVIWQAANPEEAQNIRRWFGRKASVIVAQCLHGPIESNAVTDIQRTKRPGSLSVAYLARITRNKNLVGALRAVSQVRGEVEFHIYGHQQDTAYWKQCSRLIELVPPNVTVQVHGPLAHEHVLPALRQHHLFFLPTYGESFGHAILEALLAGCAVLISDRTPWQQLQDKAIGWSIPLEAPEQFHRILQHLVEMGNDEFQAMSRRARECGLEVVRNGEAFQRSMLLFQRAALQCRTAA